MIEKLKLGSNLWFYHCIFLALFLSCLYLDSGIFFLCFGTFYWSTQRRVLWVTVGQRDLQLSRCSHPPKSSLFFSSSFLLRGEFKMENCNWYGLINSISKISRGSQENSHTSVFKWHLLHVCSWLKGFKMFILTSPTSFVMQSTFPLLIRMISEWVFGIYWPNKIVNKWIIVQEYKSFGCLHLWTVDSEEADRKRGETEGRTGPWLESKNSCGNVACTLTMWLFGWDPEAVVKSHSCHCCWRSNIFYSILDFLWSSPLKWCMFHIRG